MKTPVEVTLSPTVPVTLPTSRKSDGSLQEKDFELVFDFNTVCLIEEETKRNLLTRQGWDNLNGRDLSVFLWAALQERQPELTLKQVRRMINPGNAAMVTEKLLAAWSASAPKPSPDPSQPTVA